MKRLVSVILVMLIALASLMAQGATEAYPSKPIDIVLGASAGSGGDVASRLIAKYLGQELGVTVNVINTPGGSGIPAVQSVLSAPVDGYTLMSDQGLSSSYQEALDELPYDLYADRKYICKIVSGPQVLCGDPKMGWDDITDVGEYLKANPGKEFTWAGIGKSSAANFAVLQFMNEYGIDVKSTKEIRYGGGGEILAAIAGGHVQIGSCAASGVPSFAQDGSVKPLVVCGSSRLASLPDVPCAAELGLDGLVADFWIGLSGSKDLSDDVVNALIAAVEKVIVNPDFLADIGRVGLVVNYVGPDGIVEALKAEGENVKKLVALGN